MGFSRKEYWSGLPCPPPGDLPNPEIKPRSPALWADSTVWATRESDDDQQTPRSQGKGVGQILPHRLQEELTLRACRPQTSQTFPELFYRCLPWKPVRLWYFVMAAQENNTMGIFIWWKFFRLWKKKKKYLTIYFGRCWVFVVAFLQLWPVGNTLRWGAQASHCGGSSCFRAQALGARASVVATHGLSSCRAWASLLHSMWDLPGPGIELLSPALAGRFLSTVPPGKSGYELMISAFFCMWDICPKYIEITCGWANNRILKYWNIHKDFKRLLK